MTRKIRVLHLLVTTSPGGGPKHVFDLVSHLPRDEFEVVVAAPRDGSSSSGSRTSTWRWWRNCR